MRAKRIMLSVAAIVVSIGTAFVVTGCGQDPVPAEETTQPSVEETTVPPQTTMEPSTTEETRAASTGQSIMDEGQVLEIALKDAGKTETEVGYPNIDLKTKDGRQVYEVRFNQNTTFWEYEIDAKTGAVLSKSVDKETQVD